MSKQPHLSPRHRAIARAGAAFAIVAVLMAGCPAAETKPAASPPPSTWISLSSADIAAPALKTRLDAAKAKGWPVLIDFAADWCAACEELDKDVLSHPKMRAALAPFLKLRIDATVETDDVKSIQTHFGVNMLPTIVVLGRDGAEVKAARVDEYMDRATFRARIARVRLTK